VEYPGLILISGELYASPSYLGDALWYFAMIVSHETAHQWWYSVVGNDVIGEPWLDEALVTYSSGIYIEELLDEADYQKLLDHWHSNYQQAQAWVDTPITASLNRFPNGHGYYGIVYCGGALFYRQLCKELGDELFFASLQEYFQRFKYQVATTEDLLEIFEEISGRNLEDLYDQWLFAPARSLVGAW
jgi:aminopeptidase N